MGRKVYTYTLTQDMQFGQLHVAGGTVLGSLVVDVDGVDPSQLLSLSQYRQAEVSVLDEDDLDRSKNSETEVVDTLPEGKPEPQSGPVSEETQDESDETESQPQGSDLGSLNIDEKLIEALLLNDIKTVEELRKFVDDGGELEKLQKIGAVRAHKILAAIDPSVPR